MIELVTSVIVSFVLGFALANVVNVRKRVKRVEALKRYQSMMNHPSFSEVDGFLSDGKGNFYKGALDHTMQTNAWKSWDN
jgi:hypothetical protein